MLYLPEEDLIYCYEEGVRVKLYSRIPKQDGDITRIKTGFMKGLYDPSETKVMIYLPHIADFPDYAKTLFHELAHAVDYALFDDRYSEEEIETIAVQTYNVKPSLFDFIKEMYKLRNTKFERNKLM